VIPGLTDHEMPAILAAAARAGAVTAGYVPLRLPYGVSGLFEEWLDLHAPGEKNKILNRIRSIRDGRLNDPNFSTRMRGSGAYAEQLRQLFEVSCRKAGMKRERPALSAASFRRPGSAQMELFR
jgi:DNA repair photolyase